MARLVREVKNIAGLGGQLRISNPPNNRLTQSIPDDGLNFEVGVWEIQHEYINADVTSSGGNGAKQYRRTAVDFKFRAELPWDASSDFGPFAEMAFLPFPGGLETDSSFSITFRLGDEAFHPIGGHLYYFCDEVLLSRAFIVDDATGEDVIRIVIEGQGSALLRGFSGGAEAFGG